MFFFLSRIPTPTVLRLLVDSRSSGLENLASTPSMAVELVGITKGCQVPCTKKGDCWHQEKRVEGCSQSLLSERLVQSRSVGELFINYSPKLYETDNS